MDNHNTTKDGIYNLLDINSYQQFQLSEKTCAITVGNNLTSLNINFQLPGGEFSLIKHWDEAIEYLRDLQKPPNIIMEMAHFNEGITNIYYKPTITEISIMYSNDAKSEF